MRRTGNRKLRGRRGASLLIALLFTLVGAMVAVVIVTASTTAVKRAHDDASRQADAQAYLSLQSAAQLLRDMLKETAYVYEAPEGETPYYRLPDGTSDAFAQKICGALNGASNVSFTVSVTAPSGWAAAFPNVVTMEMTIEENDEEAGELDLEAVVTFQNSESDQRLFLTGVFYTPDYPSATETHKFQKVELSTRLS